MFQNENLNHLLFVKNRNKLSLKFVKYVLYNFD